jgi:hypothetical protein
MAIVAAIDGRPLRIGREPAVNHFKSSESFSIFGTVKRSSGEAASRRAIKVPRGNREPMAGATGTRPDSLPQPDPSISQAELISANCRAEINLFPISW